MPVIHSNLSYAAVFLLKLLRPELAEYANTAEILTEVESAVKILEDSTVDAAHAPALYAGFLKVLLQSKRSASDGDTVNGGAIIAETGKDVNLDPLLARPNPFAQVGSSHATGEPSHINPFGFVNDAHLTEPSNHQPGAFSLDQLGQSGFWENLSMRKLDALFFCRRLPLSTPGCRGVGERSSATARRGLTLTFSVHSSTLSPPLLQLVSVPHLRTAFRQAISSKATHGLSAFQTLPPRPVRILPRPNDQGGRNKSFLKGTPALPSSASTQHAHTHDV